MEPARFSITHTADSSMKKVIWERDKGREGGRHTRTDKHTDTHTVTDGTLGITLTVHTFLCVTWPTVMSLTDIMT